MADFDYGNARLRAMKSRLLTRPALEELAGAENMPVLINALLKTPYREAVEAALVQYTGAEIITQARRNNLIHTVSKVRHFYSGESAELTRWVLRRYDVDNVKAILRGLTQQVPADEIQASTLPIGELQPADLETLARLANTRAAIDVLATWRFPLAQLLLALRAEKAGGDLFTMELALEQWYFRAAMTATKEDGESLRQSLRLQADIMNILTALRLVGDTEAAAFLRQRFDAADATPLFIGPGHVAFALLSEAAKQESVWRAVEVFAHTSYGPMLAEALSQYQVTYRLSDFEYALQYRQLKQAVNLLIRDPLGIGVLIGYIALKTNELANLHRIVQGVNRGEAANRIRAELMLVNA
ncbi:MAG: V-type ATPase subunit [Ardenticatenaceae bacterium]|nr:V-type ATPase subunit [Ardenticatenaceae bacterium]MCB9445091.1 V-type ATPase subunit [Ardenticatenaceae bacterium]